MSMIVTVTPNPALDKILRATTLDLGQRNRLPVDAVAGGRGITIARALKTLNAPVVAAALAGGRTGDRIGDLLAADGVPTDLARIAAESRTSMVVVEITTGRRTTIEEWGPLVDAREVEAFERTIRLLAGGADTIVLAGSLPRGVSDEWYAARVRELRRRDLDVVLDLEGEPLRLALAESPSLVFVAQADAENLVDLDFAGEEDFLHGLEEIAEMGARSVVIHDDSGVYALARDGQRSRRFRVEAPVGGALEPSAVFAGILAERSRGKDVDRCLRAGVAAGFVASADSAGRFSLAAAEEMAGRVRVRELVVASST